MKFERLFLYEIAEISRHVY